MTNRESTLTRNPIYRFRDFGDAQDWVNHGVIAQRIMLGDDERFWVVRPADAARLERQGYEYAA